mmetsp:Transcript_7137/g.9934  ORF Transcript_7137/g.9934 Transcript_7137/m.9934 type:complete len:83 (-) Transcript_7137:951-1199(-)
MTSKRKRQAGEAKHHKIEIFDMYISQIRGERDREREREYDNIETEIRRCCKFLNTHSCISFRQGVSECNLSPRQKSKRIFAN